MNGLQVLVLGGSKADETSASSSRRERKTVHEGTYNHFYSGHGFWVSMVLTSICMTNLMHPEAA